MQLSNEMQLRRELITCLKLINGLLAIGYIAGAVYAVVTVIQMIG